MNIIIIITITVITVITVMTQPRELQITNRGKRFRLSRAGVEASLLNVSPEQVRKYGVEIHGQEYPVIQIIAVATGTPKIEWSTFNTYRILQRLGFEVHTHE